MLRIKDTEKFTRFQRFRPNKEFYERTKFTSQDLGNWIVTILSSYELDDDVWEFLIALQRANEGGNRAVRVSVSAIEEGQTTARIKSADTWKKAEEIADWVDIQVAQDCKQDAAVHEACERWQVTKRDVFRYLKRVRAWRVEINQSHYGDLDWGDYIEGFGIAPDGKLVTSG